MAPVNSLLMVLPAQSSPSQALRFSPPFN